MYLANTCTCIFGGKKDLCTICMMGFWNIYAMPHVHVFRQITLQKILTRRSKILLKNIHRYNIYWQSWYLFVLIWFLYFTISVSIVMKEVTGKWFKTVSVLNPVCCKCPYYFKWLVSVTAEASDEEERSPKIYVQDSGQEIAGDETRSAVLRNRPNRRCVCHDTTRGRWGRFLINKLETFYVFWVFL